MKNIYVGNLPYSVRDDELRATFEEYGTVQAAEVIIDRRRNRSRGYGFVVMNDDDEARAAIQALDGWKLHGRSLRVDESRPKSDDDATGGDRSRSDERSRSRRTDERSSQEQAKGGTGLVGFIKKLFG